MRERHVLPDFICLVGVDGCGKSTLARILQRELAARGIRSRVVWLRMNYFLTRPVLLYCRLAGLTRRPVVAGQRISIHEFQRSPLVAKVVQYLHWLDTALAYFFKAFLPMRLRGETIICDRFVYDVLIDFIVESGNPGLHRNLIHRLLFGLLPRRAKLVLIKADREVIIARRPDVLATDPHFDARFAEYATIDRQYGLPVVDNNDSLEKAASDVLSRVLG